MASNTVSPSLAGLTPEQLQGVTSVGTSLLLSAAAGSGKTRVLAERCAYLVCDAPQPHQCEVDELLVVTFTEAAAAEMRERIGKVLESRLKESPSPRLRKQLALLEQAQISTLHAFCSRLLRQHFHLIGLDPGFTVMDEHEARLLRLEVGRSVFRRRYETDRNGHFQQLLDGYMEGDDERLLGEVLRLHDVLGSMIDPDHWIADSVEKIEQASKSPQLIRSELGRALVELIRSRIADFGKRCNEAIASLRSYGLPEFEQYALRAEELRDTCRHLYMLIGKSGLDAVAEEAAAAAESLPKFKAVSSTVPDKQEAKGEIDELVKEFKAGGWRTMLRFTESQWKQGLQSVLPHVRELMDVVRAFGAAYKREKQEARQLDFSDLERLSLDVLLDRSQPGSRPSVTALDYQRRLKHVLVDEFQDINAVQASILRLVSRDGSASANNPPQWTPNLFSVGDVKQSIYRFRLADPALFLARERALRDDKTGRGKVIDLRQNFRTRGPLLEAINAVFSRLMTEKAVEIEYNETQRLVPGRQFGDSQGKPVFLGAPIELHVLTDQSEPSAEAEAAADVGDAGWDRTDREAALVAQRILQIIGRGEEPAMHVYDRDKSAPRPAAYRDIVILLRSKRYKANQFVSVLESFGIPAHADSGTGFFESQEIRDVISLLCLLDNQQQDLELAAYLRSPLARLADVEDALARVRIAAPQQDRAPVPFHQAVTRYAAEQTDELAEQLKALLARLSDWRQAANRQPVHDTIWQIYHETGYLAYVGGLTNGRQRVANLLSMYDHARAFGSHRRQGLGRFLEFLRSIEAESDLGQPSVATEANDVVRIMTIHASKGLEFPIVIVPDCGKRMNFQDESGPILLDRNAGIGMPVSDEQLLVRYPSLASVLVKDRIHRKSVAEELRVLYVAMTRAMEHLILVGTAAAEKPEKWYQRWSTHVGPLPDSNIVAATTLLDWLGPVWAAEQSSDSPGLNLQVHSIEDIDRSRPGREAVQRSPEMALVCERKPLPVKSAMSAEAADVIARLEYLYPHEDAMHRPAVKSVTALAKPAMTPASKDDSFIVAPVLDGTAAAGPVATDSGNLGLPLFMAEEAPTEATQMGTAVHLVLQHLEFSRITTLDDLNAQVDEMVSSKRIPKELHESIDNAALKDVLWFVTETDIGRLIQRSEATMIREMPVIFAAQESAEQAADQTMIRGRLDLFIPKADGGVIVDYKTDNVRTTAQVEQRLAIYGEQLRLYREALSRMLGKPLISGYLVFLRARRVVAV